MNIGQIRIEQFNTGDKFDIEKDIPKIEEHIFDAISNIDSQLLEQDTDLNPDDYVYASEIKSEVRSFNPFIIQQQNSSA